MGFGIAQHALRNYRTGEWGHLSVNRSLIFLGLDVMRNKANEAEVSQNTLIAEMQDLDIGTILYGGTRIIPDELLKKYRSIIGACIWLRRTRFDTAYQVAILPTNAPTSTEDPTEIRRTVRNSNKRVRYLQSHEVPLKFGDMWPGGGEATLRKLQTLVLFGFPTLGM